MSGRLGLGTVAAMPIVLALFLCACQAGDPARGAGSMAAAPAAATASAPAAGQAPAATNPSAQPPAAPVPNGPHDATAHEPFTDPGRWAKLFDDPDRDTWQKPGEVVSALGVRPGMIVADLGAGTGYFESYLAHAVGKSGLVLAVDPEPEMVQYLGRRVRKDALGNVLPVLALNDEPFLPKAHVDRVLIVDTYHHIDDRIDYFARMRSALAPGGRVAVVDFHKRPLPVGPAPQHKLERDFVVEEMVQAGWRLADEKTFLPYQYYLIFEPTPKGGADAARPPTGAPR